MVIFENDSFLIEKYLPFVFPDLKTVWDGKSSVIALHCRTKEQYIIQPIDIYWITTNAFANELIKLMSTLVLNKISLCFMAKGSMPVLFFNIENPFFYHCNIFTTQNFSPEQE